MAWRYRFFIAAVLVALTVPRMAQRGMFGDGLMYATVSRNLSVGDGVFWAPTYTATLHPAFHEHPPLGFGLQSLAFRIGGDSPVTERAYSMVMFAGTAILIVAIWRRLLPVPYDWLPLLFWILPSTTTWVVVNNMLENTQALFTTGAVLCLMLACEGSGLRRAVLWTLAAAVGVVAAILTKGPVGFFPLAVPMLWIVLREPRDWRRTAVVTGVLVAAIATFATVLMLYEPSREALAAYGQQQVLSSLAGERETNGDPLATVRHLGLGIMARMALVAAVCWLLARKRSPLMPDWRTATLFFAIAVSASLPIAVSPKLAGHYFIPSIPFFALGFACLALPSIQSLTATARHTSLQIPMALGVILLVASVVVPLTRGSVEPRDQSLIAELDALSAEMPRRGVIGTCTDQVSNWRLHSYVNRFFRVSLDAANAPVNGVFLHVEGSCAPPPSCVVAAGGPTLTLYRCQLAR